LVRAKVSYAKVSLGNRIIGPEFQCLLIEGNRFAISTLAAKRNGKVIENLDRSRSQSESLTKRSFCCNVIPLLQSARSLGHKLQELLLGHHGMRKPKIVRTIARLVLLRALLRD
jgi:hypothetical protein